MLLVDMLCLTHKISDKLQFAIGYLYNLSKRTAPYVHYAQVKNKGGATFTNGGVAPTPNGSTAGFEVGIRHFF